MEDLQIVKLYYDRAQDAIVQTDIKYGKLLFSIAHNILKNHEDSEETVSDTYQKAWTHIPPDRPNILSAYLGRITRNLSINLWHKNRASKRYSGGDILLSELNECIPDKNANISTENEITNVINDWLKSLKTDDRILFIKRYWYCISVNELAKEAGTTANKLASRLYRLREKLKKTLEKEGISL